MTLIQTSAKELFRPLSELLLLLFILTSMIVHLTENLLNEPKNKLLLFFLTDEYSFPKLPPGVDQDSNSNEQSPKSPPKIKKPPNTGGRINLTYLKRQRELAAK